MLVISDVTVMWWCETRGQCLADARQQRAAQTDEIAVTCMS